MKKKRGNIIRGIILLLLGGISILLFGYGYGYFQKRIAINQIEEEMKSDSVQVLQYYKKADVEHQTVQTVSKQIQDDMFTILSYLMHNDQNFSFSRSYFRQVNDILETVNVMVIDRYGKVKVSALSGISEVEPSCMEELSATFDTGKMSMSMRRIESDDDYAVSQVESVPNLYSEEFFQMGIVPEDVMTDSTEAYYEGLEDENNYSKDSGNVSTQESYPDLYMFAEKINDDYAFVIESTIVSEVYFDTSTEPWRLALEHESIGSDGFAFAWSAKDHRILYYPESDLIGEDISTLGMNLERIVDRQFIWQNLNGARVYMYPVFSEEEEAWIAYVAPENSLIRAYRPLIINVWVIFAVFALDMVYYMILLMSGEEQVHIDEALFIGQPPHYRGKKTKLFIFTLFVTTVIFLCAFYLSTLFRMSDWTKRSETTIRAAQTSMEGRDAFLSAYPSYYAHRQKNIAQAIAWFLQNNGDKVTVDTLNEICGSLQLDKLKVTDFNGDVEAESSYMSLNVAYEEFVNEMLTDSSAVSQTGSSGTEQAGSAESGKQGQTTEDQASDSGSDQKESSAAGLTGTSTIHATMFDKNGKVNGNLELTYLTAKENAVLRTQTVESVFSRIHPGEGSFLFSVNKESHLVTYHPDSSMIGKSSDEFGLSKENLQDNLCDLVTVKRISYYVLSGSAGTEYVYVAIVEEDLLHNRMPMTALATIIAFCLLLLIGVVLYADRTHDTYTTVDEPDMLDRHGKKTPEYKAFRILIYAAIIAAAVITLGSVQYRYGNTDSVLDYVRNGNWKRGLNAFALMSSLLLISKGGILIYIFRKITYLLSGILPIRAGTILRMLSSLISYLAAFLILYLCCVDFGMPTTALMASAGIVSVVIGIGANSLVGDIIAGVFLLLEGSVQVGDLIEVDGFEGYVQEPGIRMTTLYSRITGQVKIIPNKEVMNVIHKSMHPAIMMLDYQIAYEEDLARAERLLKEELNRMEGTIPTLIGKPVYMGVSALEQNGVNLRIRILGHERNRRVLCYAVNRRIYTMFNRNHITIPFAQVTIHSSSERKEEEYLSVVSEEENQKKEPEQN